MCEEDRLRVHPSKTIVTTQSRRKFNEILPFTNVNCLAEGAVLLLFRQVSLVICHGCLVNKQGSILSGVLENDTASP